MVAPIALSPDYAHARRDFLDRARLAGAEVVSHEHPETGPDGGQIAVDVAWLGPADAARVVVVVSGTHGVEGFAGSSLQRTWLGESSPTRPADLAVCLVHALNPYGFVWVWRVNEDNVDLNRNFADFDDPPANDGYDRIADAVVPATFDADTQARTAAEILELAGEHGFETIQQWVSGGQYRHPDGVFYGGTAPVWSHRVLDELVDGILAGRTAVSIIDLHTGLGPWGHGELISSAAPDDGEYQRAVAWYGDEVTSLQAGDSVSAELAGEWLPHVTSRLEAGGCTATGVALKFGTVDGIAVLTALRADAWLHAHGDPAGPESVAIKADLRAAFADDDPRWIEALWHRFAEVLGAAFTGLTGD